MCRGEQSEHVRRCLGAIKGSVCVGASVRVCVGASKASTCVCRGEQRVCVCRGEGKAGMPRRARNSKRA